MATFALYNAKGGVGKTTTAVNLAAALAELGRRVLVVDLDAQGSATQALGKRDDGRRLADSLLGGDPLPVETTSTEGVDLVPAGLALAGAEKALVREVGAEMLLRSKLAALGEYDLILLDAPPGVTTLSVGALVASTRVLVPVTPHPLALGGLAGLLQVLNTIRERLNPQLELGAIVLTMYDGRTLLARQIYEDLKRRFGARVLGAVIRHTVKIAEAAGHGRPVLGYAPQSSGAADYRELARAVLETIACPVALTA